MFIQMEEKKNSRCQQGWMRDGTIWSVTRSVYMSLLDSSRGCDEGVSRKGKCGSSYTGDGYMQESEGQ